MYKITPEYESLAREVLLKKEAIDNSDGKWVAYDKWFEKSEHKAMARTYAFYLFKAAEIHLGEKEVASLKKDDRKFYDRFPHYANKFIEIAKEYLATKKENKFDNREWYFYWLSVAERKEKHLKIARALLSTKTGGKAFLKNLKDGFSVDYIGSFGLIEGKRKVVYFDMKDHLTEPTRELHIKIVYTRENDPIMLGTYTTYDEQFVYSGRLVLVQITGEKINEEDKKPLYCSNKFNTDAFKNVPEAIRDYLSIKEKNYFSIPSTVPDEDELKTYLAEYVPLKNKANRFLEFERPRLYLATPQGSLKSQEEKGALQQLVTALESSLKDKEIALISKEAKSGQELSSVDSLVLLRRTKYFVLILAEMSKASYSLVQLGWAMAHCKNIMIIYKDDHTSDRIKAISSNMVTKYPYISLENSKDQIVKEILSFIKDGEKNG